MARAVNFRHNLVYNQAYRNDIKSVIIVTSVIHVPVSAARRVIMHVVYTLQFILIWLL